MKIVIPQKNLLSRINDVDYFDWNYKFPIKYVQLYRFKAIIKLLGDKKYTNLLEIGTGSGILLSELVRHCDKLYACDIHPHMDKIKSLLHNYEIKKYEIKSQSIEKTEYPDNYFDVIVGVSVLEFVNNLHSTISEITNT